MISSILKDINNLCETYLNEAKFEECLTRKIAKIFSAITEEAPKVDNLGRANVSKKCEKKHNYQNKIWSYSDMIAFPSDDFIF